MENRIDKFNQFIKKFSKTNYISKKSEKDISDILTKNNFIKIFNDVKKSKSLLENFDIDTFRDLWNGYIYYEFDIQLSQIYANSLLIIDKNYDGSVIDLYIDKLTRMRLEDSDHVFVENIIDKVILNRKSLLNRRESDSKFLISYDLMQYNKMRGVIDIVITPRIKLWIERDDDNYEVDKMKYDDDLLKEIENLKKSYYTITGTKINIELPYFDSNPIIVSLS
jgi:hypothetical protein